MEIKVGIFLIFLLKLPQVQKAISYHPVLPNATMQYYVQ
jgi:hypothetical protein